MKILDNLKLDSWYGIILYVGILMIAASLLFKVDFLEEKHLFGLGIGLFLIGFSFWMAEKGEHAFKPPNFQTGGAALFYWKVIKHSPITIIILIIGICLTVLFGYLVIQSLI